jgi:hypothetical protein
MSAHVGSDIITNGLTLCLDAGNTKSYPDSGTTWSDNKVLTSSEIKQNYTAQKGRFNL